MGLPMNQKNALSGNRQAVAEERASHRAARKRTPSIRGAPTTWTPESPPVCVELDAGEPGAGLADASYTIRPRPAAAMRQNASNDGRIGLIRFDSVGFSALSFPVPHFYFLLSKFYFLLPFFDILSERDRQDL